MTDPQPVASGEKTGSKRVLLIFIGLVITELLAALDQTIFATALPTIVGQLHGVDQMLWVTTAYLLASTVALPIYGKLGDLIGRRSLFIGALVAFIIGSIVGGFAPDMTWLIIGRAIQGIGGGGLMILSDTIVADIVPARQRARYMGIIGSVLVFSALLGPLLGGWFADVIGWRWGLWINIPLGLLALVGAVFFLRLPKPAVGKPRIDWPGIGLLSLASVCLVLVTTWGGTTYAWDSLPIILLIAVTVIAAVLFVLVERRAVEPVMPLSLFRDRNFNLSTFAGLIVGLAMFGTMAYMPTYLQMVSGVNASVAGLLTVPLLIALMAVAVSSGEIVSRTGHYKWLVIIGTGIVGVSLFLLSTLTPGQPVWVTCVYLAIMGVGLGAVMQNLLLVVQNSFPASMVGTATSTNNYFRQIGSSIGGALVGSLFAARLADLLTDRLPAGALASTGGANAITPALVHSVPDSIRDIITGAYNDALTPIFLFIIPLVLAAVVMLFFMVEKPLATTIEGAAVTEATDDTAGEGAGRDSVEANADESTGERVS